MAEAYRLSLVRGLESRLVSAGYELVAGVDEVGRGCLAGPVVAAAVIPSPDTLIPGVDDSKRLPAGERESLAEAIRQTSIAYAVVAVEAEVIDRVNILQATKLAMREALWSLDTRPDLALIDAVALDATPCPCVPVVRGDLLSYAIACASIVAKVERDRSMCDLAETYPYFGFADNKGYAAPAHLEGLATFGPTPEHRLTFRSVVPRLEASA
jgi:ribonuclease HII